MDFLEISRIVLGFTVFLTAGWFACNALFKKTELDLVEKIVLSITFALIIPTVLILFASLAFRIRLNEFAVYGAYVLVVIASFAYRKFDLSAFSLNA